MAVIKIILYGVLFYFVFGYIFISIYEKYSDFFKQLLKIEEEMRSDG